MENHENLKILHTNLAIKAFKIDEYIKSEKIYYCNFKESGRLELYDQFLNKFYSTNEPFFKDDIDLILSKGGKKNILYLNKPISVQKLASQLASKMPTAVSSVINRACKALAGYVHNQYFLIECLKRGVVYHHGSVPDIIKLYIEKLFIETPDIRFISTTSTLLEGVNIPADRLFLLDYKKGRRRLSSSQLKNLIGRICRFKEIFDPINGGLDLLEPKVYLICSNYVSDSANTRSFLEQTLKADKPINENPENVLLEKTNLSELQKSEKDRVEQFLENFEPGSINNQAIRVAKTNFGKACFANAISEINILENEIKCQQIIDESISKDVLIDTPDDLLNLVDKIFIPQDRKSVV